VNARPGVRQRAVLIAPFAPDHPAENLGAYQKITTVIGLLGRLGYDVHVLDSSHTAPTFARAILGAATEVRNQTVTLWRPARIPHRAAGKLLNWLAPSSVLSRLEGLRPELVWLYNSYAFEGRVGIALQKRTGARLVLELEDLPLARARRWSPKPRLDHWYFRRLLTSADAVTYVNARLQQDFPPDHGASLLFPSILDAALCAATAPARFGSPMRRLGYFGGLDVEKGCGVLLNAVPRLAPRWRLVVTGAGPLEAEFRDAARRFPDRVEFHGRVAPTCCG